MIDGRLEARGKRQRSRREHIHLASSNLTYINRILQSFAGGGRQEIYLYLATLALG
jgi:hypothetical protein